VWLFAVRVEFLCVFLKHTCCRAEGARSALAEDWSDGRHVSLSFAQPNILWFGVSARQEGTKFIGFRCSCDFEVALPFSCAHLQLTNTYSCKRGIEYMYPGTNCEPTLKLRCMKAAPIVKPLLSSATKHSRISREHVAQQSRHVKALVFNEFR